MSGPPYHGRTHLRRGTDPVPFGGSMPWILFKRDLNGFIAVNGVSSYPELTTLQNSPPTTGSTDATVYGGIDAGDVQVEISSGGPFKSVEIRAAGLYLVEMTLIWFLNWGKVRLNYEITHTDPATSAITFSDFINGTENSYFGGWTDAGAPQILLTCRTYLAVEESTPDVRVRGFVQNDSGTNRTYGTTIGTNVGHFSLAIIQLSDTGDSNPA